ncbi:MAG: hypothetical protein JXN10_07910 [Clostridia bacterium]|nr:hypothetical protein [Clostridia bacterium]MBN2883438.1 hypothetical protein [Clostridia bacterium]
MKINDIKARRQLYNEKYLTHMLDVIKDDGSSPDLAVPVGAREVIWHCFPLFEMGGKFAEKANSIIRNMEFRKCHFMPMNLTQLIMRYGDSIDDDVMEKMKQYILNMLPSGTDERLHISMYNDNFAGMAIYTLIVAGELFGLPEYVEAGMEKLQGVADLFMRCGAIMEFGSNTYTPIDTLCYAEMSNHIKNPKARELALKCEERMWTEIATHYHPETSRLAGPHSRSYSIDMVGHPHLMSGLSWFIFGDRVFANPILDLFEPHQNQVMHGGLENLTLPNIAWIINCDYHCPDYLEEFAFNKSYPYETEYMTECIPSNVYHETPEEVMHEYPGVRGRNYTYMTEEFAMGTAQSQFHGGAVSDSFAITYRNKNSAKRLFDTGVIYSRYIFNDRFPGQDNEYKLFGKVNYTGFRDEGRKICLQDKGAAIVSYKPKQYERENMSSSGLSVMIPIHFFDDIEIFTDKGKISEYPYYSNEKCNIFVRIHKSFFAIIPLEVTDLGRDVYLRIEKRNHHIAVTLYNYKGPEKSFGEKELVLSRNGFVCLAETGYESMEEFIGFAKNHKLEDRMEKQEGAWTRRIRFTNSKTDLNLMYSPLTEGIFVSTVNKRPTGLCILKADGLNTDMVPLL